MKTVIYLILFFFGLQTSAQQRKAVTYQQQVQAQKAEREAPHAIIETKYRIVGAFEQAFTSPKDLNDFRNEQLWVNTPAAGETFSSLPGFAASFGYKKENSIYSLELDQYGKKLSSADVSATTSVRDSIEVETLQLTYDHVFQDSPEDSIELGAGIGKALKFRYINHITTTSIGNPANETGIIWEDSPFVFSVRAAYNYFFSANVGLRFAVGYQYLTSDELKAADTYNATYFGIPVTSGKSLTDSNNQNVKMDLSGVKATAGLSVNF